eukprot:CAMPEP_0181203676 /NCGR_PEP_ID=MMETSP1096-20121128/19522_1 /TAXON_ID=156174 ORGANISM="Chrysochromulina ericina, Strain CCMP281" /NCGR_SAMPLE_ID=MMETSP1096 /ASSEMBLY_ACC=CAM_ASM_000453 /LENGTH=59 /DNA_ID=CAMNT_0023294311 /DNA_START=693 /DNA_END=872 /DNA_ORIENTATION=-
MRPVPFKQERDDTRGGGEEGETRQDGAVRLSPVRLVGRLEADGRTGDKEEDTKCKREEG